MITVENLTKKFTRTVQPGETEGGQAKHRKKQTKKEEFYALDHISFSVTQGEIVGILGPNGAGKTTLLRMLGTLMEPTEGRVILTDEAGNQITDPVQIKQNIGYLSGNTKLYHRLSTREMLRMLGEIYEMPKEAVEKRIEEIVQVLDMGAFIDNRIEKLSTGQTQRASIARCLIHSPAIYIFDEPTLGLDILSADAIDPEGKTVLYSTHYLEEAQFLCDRIIMIDKGKIMIEGSPAEIMEQTQTRTLREAFGRLYMGR